MKSEPEANSRSGRRRAKRPTTRLHRGIKQHLRGGSNISSTKADRRHTPGHLLQHEITMYNDLMTTFSTRGMDPLYIDCAHLTGTLSNATDGFEAR